MFRIWQIDLGGRPSAQTLSYKSEFVLLWEQKFCANRAESIGDRKPVAMGTPGFRWQEGCCRFRTGLHLALPLLPRFEGAPSAALVTVWAVSEVIPGRGLELAVGFGAQPEVSTAEGVNEPLHARSLFCPGPPFFPSGGRGAVVMETKKKPRPGKA